MTVNQAARYLETGMGEDVARITDRRYRQVRVDEHDLSFDVWSPERAGWIPAQQLSQGTLDQVYLAARLGLVRQVTKGRRPPLIFDDPFVTFDDQRAHRAAELVKDLAKEHQVLFLTASDRYDPVADLVIELPAPTARDGDGPLADRRAHGGAADDGHGSSEGDGLDGWQAIASNGPAPWATAPVSTAVAATGDVASNGAVPAGRLDEAAD